MSPRSATYDPRELTFRKAGEENLRARLHGRRVTLLEGLPSLRGQKIALLYMRRDIPRAILSVKARKPQTITRSLST